MLLETVLTKCDERSRRVEGHPCHECTYGVRCPHNCEKCLEYIHNPNSAPIGAPKRKYDCKYMADFYTCKYSCRYASEIVYALEQSEYLSNEKNLKILSFGCGPCTDLFAIDYLRCKGVFTYDELEYRGIDYSEDVWEDIHRDIKNYKNKDYKIVFYYEDLCKFIKRIANGIWTPNLVSFQYVFSDMRKHTDKEKIDEFIDIFNWYFNEKALPGTQIILNDVNLAVGYEGGRDYFDQLLNGLDNVSHWKGRFRNDNRSRGYYPKGYPYGDDSRGEFPHNKNRFDLSPWRRYNPFDACASAQMFITKEG